MSDVKEKVLSILNELTGEDVSDRLTENLYRSALLDSMGAVQLLLALQDEFGIDVSISEFNRMDWDTPAKIVMKVESLK
ncbi:D-alanine--poly(phosphoribitol) ligase subunit DltC [Lentilactobacillus diolivorans]|uniref:D-alanyl carrier protein n=1 Tax=Lentilactobacillus diolivorans TaxID=179838 RepID=A0ABQ0XP37_9LACO|nr:D-alanine--poly(phosphoribitol) ligase subunit DltC [Lentilactobacillus diolivorans]GEP25200.1 D-alanine--poly(phosphoribitol) ligase subunit 2 [Lentilactobacillus diolivorans]